MTAEPWLPEILPSGWVVAQMRRIATFRNGADYKEVEVTEGGYPVYGSGGEFRRASQYLYDGESVLFGRKGTIDKPLLVSGRFWTVDTMFFTELTSNIEPRYLHYYATTMPFDYYSTSTALPSMTQGELGGHRIPLPPITEQGAIADFLDRETARIDTLIREQRRLIELLRERRIAVAEGPVVGLSWSTPLRSVTALIQTGPFGSQLKSDEYETGGTPVINPSHLVMGRIEPDERVAVSASKASELGRHALRAGDVIAARRGELGRCAVVRAENTGFLCGTGSALIRLRETVADPEFLALVFSSRRNRDSLSLASVGATMDNLNADIIATLRIPMPPLPEQRRIVESVAEATTKIDTLITETESFIDLAKERRSALITAAVTGQIDVRDEVA
ncbi:type I restriction-modification system specificity subunit (plasmid) [Rhodococcus jostii RHA1]|uniref:Type I restriction-modification system specificity subunit n=1 Tax=Rhodococcus jostii (strain RHA1) TaxID=101510 RepID=Q0RV87_RHOJR|nr:restriction endonuclease subunit S [Rhodococcus jostii]ABH00799.1 type I restriction-modification system specificity subunit [Rhodococcus jostii RHA1]